jgi:hypothetical protein
MYVGDGETRRDNQGQKNIKRNKEREKKNHMGEEKKSMQEKIEEM